MPIAYTGLGSNLENPIQQLNNAVLALQQLPQSHVLMVSPFYQSPPMGDVEQPDFVNAVVSIETQLSPPLLLQFFFAIELQQKRIRTQHWGPRTLDIDVLLYDNEQWSTPYLQIPHAGIKMRAFVLYPLLDIAPDLCLPTGEWIADLKALVDATGLKQLS